VDSLSSASSKPSQLCELGNRRRIISVCRRPCQKRRGDNLPLATL